MSTSEVGGAGPVAPHRGVLILILGILGWVSGCVIFGIVAWVMGNTDLAEMRAGRMDKSGEGMTQIGKIIGMISVILSVIGLLIGLAVFALFGAAIFMGDVKPNKAVAPPPVRIEQNKPN